VADGLYRTIAVGYDGTRQAEHALTRAVALARSFGAKIVVVDVAAPVPIDAPDGAFGLMPYATYRSSETILLAEEALWRQHRAKVEAYLAGEGVASEFAGVVGQPAGEIVDVAEQRKADLIVVGTREAGFLERVFGGSVSEGVARHARCDVLVVHPPADEKSS
jgi:nucleotide-binding universal stress UspA family protein